MSNTFTPGQVVTNSHDFTSPIGAFFRKGERFVISNVGKNLQLHGEKCGSVVWFDIHVGQFLGCSTWGERLQVVA